MSKNTEIIEAHYAGFARGDVNAVMAPLADDIVWTEAAGFPLAGTYVGSAAVAEKVFAPLQQEWEGFAFVPDEVLDAGDAVIAVGTYTGVYAPTGRAFRARVVHLWRLRDGKAVRFEQVSDSAVIRAAMD